MVAIPFHDRVFEHSTSNSQTVFTVTGAVDTSYNAFSAFMSVGDTCFGGVEEPGVAFRNGILTYSASNELTVSTTLETKGTFSSSGSKNVFMGLPAAVAQQGLPFAAGMTNGVLVASVGSSALTIALKTVAGNDPSPADPVYVYVRSATAAAGDYTRLAITAATSLVVSSGSTLGAAANNTAFRIWIVGFNDAGTFRLGAINCLLGSDIYPLAPWDIAGSTAEGGAGAADTAQVFYTGTAVSAKAYTVLGYMTWENGLAAIGTWAAGPTRIQLFGPGVPLPNIVVQTRLSADPAGATGTTTLPADDSIPQNTEGTQFLSKAITPTSAANLIEVNSTIMMGCSTVDDITMALFQDSTAGALAATVALVAIVNNPVIMPLLYRFLAATTSATTLKIRAGSTGAATVVFNGYGGSRKMGGVSASYIRLTEIMA